MRATRTAGRLISNRNGTAAVEFAIIGTFLSFLLLGVLDFGMGFWQYIEVGNAARAGAEYAANNGWNKSGIEGAVTGATPLHAISASPDPSEFCGCPDASSGITASSCGSHCTHGGTAGTYVTVNAQATYATLFQVPGIPSTFPLSASTTVRIN